MKRLLKFLHEVATVGLMGAVAAQIVLALTAADLPPDQFATVRFAMLAVSKWLLLPSLMVVLLTGLAAFGIHKPFHDAPWAWMKAVLTIAVLEGTLVAIQAPARKAADLSAKVAGGDESVAKALDDVLRHEQGGLGVIMMLCLVNIGLAIWRPKFKWMTPT